MTLNIERRTLNIIIESCLISLVIFTPLALGTTQPWSIFILRITVVVALLAWLLKLLSSKSYSRFTIHDSPLFLPILIFLSVAVISTITSSYKWISLNILTNLFIYAAVYFLIVKNLKSKAQIKRLITAILFTSLILGIYGLLQYFNVLRLTSSVTIPSRVSSTYYNSNHYGGYLALLTPIPVALFLFSRLSWKTLLFAALSVLLIINLALSYSWGSVAFGVGVIFLIIMRVRLSKKRILATAIAIGVLAFFALLGALVMLGPTAQLPQSTWAVRYSRMADIANVSLFGRLFMYRKTIPLVLDHPLLGTGPGTFIYAFTPYRPPDLSLLWNYAHNDYLQIASEMGLIGLAAFLFFVITALTKGFKAPRSNSNFNRAIIIAALAGILSILTHGFFDGNLTMIPANILYFYVLIGVLVSSTSNLEH
ncbi:hypothetical protein ES708_02169 [subsurface metagenome]